MINNKKGKEHMPRPLKVRIIAFLTALAMVFSVIYFNNRGKSVEATVPHSTIVDGSYIEAIYNNSGNVEELTVNVPATGVTFTVPAPSHSTWKTAFALSVKRALSAVSVILSLTETSPSVFENDSHDASLFIL